MGIAPLNANERSRPGLKWLRDRVGGFPINGHCSGITVESMTPYMEAAKRARHIFYMLGTNLECCKDDDEYADLEEGEEGAEAGGEEGGEGEEEVLEARKRSRPAMYGEWQQ